MWGSGVKPLICWPVSAILAFQSTMRVEIIEGSHVKPMLRTKKKKAIWQSTKHLREAKFQNQTTWEPHILRNYNQIPESNYSFINNFQH